MNLGQVEKLARYLMASGLSSSEICKYLVLETFSHFKPSAIYAAEITQDGYLATVGSFGFPEKAIVSWGNIPLSIDAPLTQAVKRDEVLLLKRVEAIEKFPILQSWEGFPEKWDSYLVCPVLPYGVIAITLDSIPEVDHESESFVRTIGSLVSSCFHRNQGGSQSSKGARPNSGAKRKGELTSRQKQIKALIEKGYSNPAIAAEIGYSESLVRQETMAIYSILNVSGRKELMERKSD
jgi:DNA-binding CsgD family transcriptional regulator